MPRWPVVVTCVVVSSSWSAFPASADHGRPTTPGSLGQAAPRLIFEDERPLTASWSRLASPVRFDICNLGALATTALAKLAGFDIQRTKAPAVTTEVLSLKPANLTLPARICKTLTLRRGAATPDTGEFSGVIVVRTTPKEGTASLIRRNLTVSLAAGESPKPLKAAADEIVLRAKRDAPGGTITLEDPASLPLAVRGGFTAASAPPRDTVIGLLMNGDSRARVIVNGSLSDEEGVPVLPIRLEANSATGTYAGTVDLATGEADPSTVTLKVEASDGLRWALAAVLLGLLGAALLTWIVEKWLPRRDLRDRARDLLEHYRKKKEAFDEVYGARFPGYRPDEANVRRYQAAVDASITRWSKDNLLVDREGEDFKRVVTMLQEAEADADLFGDPEGFGAELTKLAAARDAFTAAFPRTAPKFMRLAVDRLTGKPLPVGGATAVAAEAQAYVALSTEWTELAVRVKRLDLWIELLRKKTLTGPDEAKLDAGAEKVGVARQQLLDVEDAEQLAEWGLGRKLERAYQDLTGPGLRQRIWYPTQEDVAARPFEPRARVTFGVGAGIAAIAHEIGGFAATGLDRSARSLVQLLVLGIGLVTAILAGLPTVFSDATFGSWSDYLAAFALGAASGAGAKGIFEVWQRLRRRERVAQPA
jgi:hypothetical protein